MSKRKIKQNAQQPNVEFTRTYFDVKAGTQKYLKTIPKFLKDYVKPIS